MLSIIFGFPVRDTRAIRPNNYSESTAVPSPPRRLVDRVRTNGFKSHVEHIQSVRQETLEISASPKFDWDLPRGVFTERSKRNAYSSVGLKRRIRLGRLVFDRCCPSVASIFRFRFFFFFKQKKFEVPHQAL